MKIVYCGFDFFSNCLSSLVAAKHEIVEVFSYKGNSRYNSCLDVVGQSEHIGCPVYFRPVNSQDIARFESIKVDLLIAAAYPYKIPVEGLKAVYGVNIHPSLLPQGRGCWPLPHFILRGLSHAGVTIHKLADRFDAGDILLQESFEVDTVRETMESLSMKARLSAQRLLDRFVASPGKFWTAATQQIGGEYWGLPTTAEQTVDWNQSVELIDRMIRAFGKCDSMGLLDGKQWVFKDATVWKEKHTFSCGEVVLRSSREILVAAKDGFVCLRFYELDPDCIGKL